MKMTKPTLEDYSKQLKITICQWDKEPLPIDKIDMYDHPWGWPVDGVEGLQWLSVQCPRCKYDWSITKLGVPQYVAPE